MLDFGQVKNQNLSLISETEDIHIYNPTLNMAAFSPLVRITGILQ